MSGFSGKRRFPENNNAHRNGNPTAGKQQKKWFVNGEI